MRLQGTIKTWDDARGFGFIEPALGGQDIFLHIKACKGLWERPRVGLVVSFEVELGPQGKKRAIRVEPLRRAQPTRRQQASHSPGQWGTATLFVLPLFGLVLALGYALGQPPIWLLWAYAGLSILTFLVYALDKSAAQSGSWRTSEKSLHVLALCGGWPGALLAQQMLRHKSNKQAFRATYWFTVVLNVLGFILMASPYAKQFMPV